MRISPGLRLASDLVTFCSVRILTTCAIVDGIPPICSAFSKGDPTLTAIITSALHWSRTSSIGTLATKAPSTSSLSPSLTGDIAAGADMLARIAFVRLPLRKTTLPPVTRSVETMETGIGNFSICGSPYSLCTISFMNNLIFCPSTAPGSISTPSLDTPVSEPGIKRLERAFRRGFCSIYRWVIIEHIPPIGLAPSPPSFHPD